MNTQYFLTNSVVDEQYKDKYKKDIDYCLRVVGAKDFDDALAREDALKVRLEEAVKLLNEAKSRLSPSVTVGAMPLSDRICAFIEYREPIYLPAHVTVSDIWVDGQKSGIIISNNGFVVHGDSAFSAVECTSTNDTVGFHHYIDKQGYPVKVGVAYLFVYAMPGPDITAMVVESLNKDGTVSGWDVNFKHKVDNIKASELFRPLEYTWADKQERQAIIEYAGESALDLKS